MLDAAGLTCPFSSSQARDYSRVSDPSILRFLVDMRGEDPTGKQLRDDLMTFLIAGHETTGAVLTWTLFSLVQNPAAMAKLVAEVDAVLGDRRPTLADIQAMPYLRNVRRPSKLSCAGPYMLVTSGAGRSGYASRPLSACRLRQRTQAMMTMTKYPLVRLDRDAETRLGPIGFPPRCLCAPADAC